MRAFNSKEHHIVRVRAWADKKLLDQHFNSPDKYPFPISHNTRLQKHIEFCYAFLKYLSGKDRNYWFLKYNSDTILCAFYDLRETSDVMYFKDNVGGLDGWDTFVISKHRPDIYEWFLNNCRSPKRFLKILPFDINILTGSYTTHIVEQSRKWAIEMLEKHPEYREIFKSS